MSKVEKLEKAVRLADAMYYAAQQLTTDASHLSKAMKDWWNFKNVELKESEDEKIRKELIDIVAKSPITFAFEDKNKVLSWLEKQGEKKPQRIISAEAKEAMYNKPAWSEEDEVYLNTTIAYLKDAKEFKKTAENCIDWLKKLKQRIGDKL